MRLCIFLTPHAPVNDEKLLYDSYIKRPKKTQIKWCEFEKWARSLCYVLVEDNSLSQCLYLLRRITGYRQIVGTA